MKSLKSLFNKRKARARWNLKKTNKGKRPRLSVHRSGTHIYAQVIDDLKGVTVAAFSTKSKEFTGKKTSNVEAAKAVGVEVAKRAIKAGVKEVIFDRGAYPYHGRVKSLADGAREGGLKF